MTCSRDRPVRAESDYSPRFLDTCDCPLHMIAECPHNMLVHLTPNNPRSTLTTTGHSFLVRISSLGSQVRVYPNRELEKQMTEIIVSGAWGWCFLNTGGLLDEYFSFKRVQSQKAEIPISTSWTTTKTPLNNSRIQICAKVDSTV